MEKPDPDDQRQQGHCFTCNWQGHIVQNCPSKPKQKPKTPPAKVRQAEAKDSNTESDASSVHGTLAKATVKWNKDLFYQMVTVAPKEDKVEAVRRAAAIEGEEGF